MLRLALWAVLGPLALGQNWFDGAVGLAEGPGRELYIFGEFPPDSYPGATHTVPTYGRGGCGTSMTPIPCRTPFFARVSAAGQLLYWTTLPTEGRYSGAAVRLAVGSTGDALLAAIQHMGGFSRPWVKIHRIGRDGRQATSPGYFPVITGLGEAPDGNILLAGYDPFVDHGGYLAVLDRALGVVREFNWLPLTPRAMAVAGDGTVFVGADTELRKYSSGFDRLLAALPLAGPAISMRVRDTNIEVVGAENNRLVYRRIWDASLERKLLESWASRKPGAVAVSPAGKFYFAQTVTIDEQVRFTPGALQTCRGMGTDDDLDAAVSGFGYGTGFAGTGHDVALGILANDDETLTFAGLTWSQDFPHPTVNLPSLPARLFVKRFRPAPQMAFSPHCVVNAASLAPGPVVPGGLTTIFGAGFPEGIAVRFDGIPAAVLFSSADQVNIQVPELTGRKTRLTLISRRWIIGAADLRVASAHPGLFTLNGLGTGYAIALNHDGAPNSAANPAPPGSEVRLFATGIHRSAPPIEVVNYAGHLSAPLEVIHDTSGASGVIEIRITEAGMERGVQIKSGGVGSRPIQQSEWRISGNNGWWWEPRSNVRLHVRD
jgi:hypothetical protein